MRRNGTDVAERGAWAGNQVHLDGQNRFRTDGEFTVQKQIVNTHYRASQRVLYRDEQRIGGAFGDGAKRSVKGRARHGDNFFAQQLHLGRFAVGARCALKSYSTWFYLKWTL